MGRFDYLVHLILNDNQLTGELPAELGGLGELKWLRLDNNSLTGELPAEMGALPELRALQIAGNQLSGCVLVGLRFLDRSDLTETGLPYC